MTYEQTIIQQAAAQQFIFLNFYILRFSYLQALSIESLLFAPVNTTFPDANINADFTWFSCLQTTPGKFQFLITFRYSQSLPISILEPRSALATILVTLNQVTFNLKMLRALVISLAALTATDSASIQLAEPMIIILPDLNMRTVLLGLVFLIITAGNLFLLNRDPSTFYAINLRSISSSICILAKETTF